MGAMDNDLNRCNHMLSSDRRCRSLIHTPGSPFCYFHANGGSKKRKSASADGAADRGLFQWLSTHPLDSVTNVNHAINLITLFLAGKRISVRRADALLRLLRVAIKSVPDVHEEFDGNWRRSHWAQGQQFLSEIQPLLAPPAPLDPPPPDPAPSPDATAAPPPSRTGSQPVLHSPDLAHHATTNSQPVHASSPMHHAADGAPSRPPVPFPLPSGNPPSSGAVTNSVALTPPASSAALAAGVSTPAANNGASAALAAPATPARAPKPPASPQANASPYRDPLLPIVQKHLPSIIRALLSDADFDFFESPKRPASAGRNPRTVSASSDGS